MQEQLREHPGGVRPALVLAIALATVAVALAALLAGPTTAVLVVALALLAFDLAVIAFTLRRPPSRLAPARDEAGGDDLTGLAERETFLHDLAAAEAGGVDAMQLLVLVELDGMQRYTRAFGQLAGDALVSHIGERLSHACAGTGRAYRIGGARFAVLAPSGAVGAQAFAAAVAAAIDERGEGFQVRAFCGAAEIPREAGATTSAVDLADRRLAEQRESAGAASAASPRQIMLRRLRAKREVESLVGYTMGGLAREAAQRLGLDSAQVARTVLAAELHDIGKAAIPREILEKPGPLSGREWLFVHRSTAVGERMLNVTVPEADVAAVVRAAGEHYDGSGSPDGLAASDIALEARIVAACAALEALLSDRPYRPARSLEEAVEALRAGAGREFDPAVVDVMCELIGHAPMLLGA